MDLTTTKIVVLAVVGLIIMVALLGEFRPRPGRRRPERLPALLLVRSPGTDAASAPVRPRPAEPQEPATDRSTALSGC